MLKSGQLLHFGRPREITAEIQGKVWECLVPAENAEWYRGILNVSNLRNLDGGLTALRVISEDAHGKRSLWSHAWRICICINFKGENEK